MYVGRRDLQKSCNGSFKNIEWLTVGELRQACVYLFENYRNEIAKETNAKRCILCLDFKENYK